ncbi:MAG: outer membrane protein assembly factor BamD [Candidatus Latescibacterota bacterium]|nr:MAG: outer membrane protein assembly factor BamD [Candidatus Latescibacterota bacterium]
MLKSRLLRGCLVAAALSGILLSAAAASAGENEDINFAKRLRRDGMYVAAAEEFMRFIEKYPQSALRPEALFAAGESYLQAGKANDALAAYEKFIEQYPRDERACLARLQRGRVLKALKRYREAADEFLMIPEESPACPVYDQALLEAGDCLISMGDSEGGSKVLRRLIAERKDSELIARARYTLAVALESTGRDLEAESVLGEVVSMYPRSPMRALALLRLGERALARGDYARAEGHFRTVEREFKDAPLPEKATLGIIDIHAKRGNVEGILDESERFLAAYRVSESRPRVMRGAVDAAWRLKKYDRALVLIDSLAASPAAADTAGELLLIGGRILLDQGETVQALARVSEMRSRFPLSPFMKDALVLEGDIRDRAGAPLEAARLYNLALMGAIDARERVRLCARLADISAEKLADTLSALRYHAIVVAEDRDGSAAEESLFKGSLLRERTGDLEGAGRGYEEIAGRFPDGARAREARDRLQWLAVRPRYTETVSQALARIAAWDAAPAHRNLETGAILVEDARDAEAATPLLEGALAGALPDSLRAKGSYYLGRSRLMRAALADSRGEDGAAERAKGLDLLRETMQKYVGLRWAERAHRAWIEGRAPAMTEAERIVRIEEYLAAYGSGSGRWWALARKAEWLMPRASAGDTASARAALGAALAVRDGNAPPSEKKQASYIAASLLRARGDHAAAARAYEAFVAAYPDDPRIAAMLFDLGESLLMQRDYAGAFAAYDRCIARSPGRLLVERCEIRKGDCLFYQGKYAESADIFSMFAAAYPESDLVPEAVYREALARERMGDDRRAEEIVGDLAGRSGVPPAIKTRSLAWLGTRYAERRDWAKARPLLVELAAAERTAANLVLAAEASLGAGDYRAAEKGFSDALGLSGADTCRAVAGRAKAYLRLQDAGAYAADARTLSARCAAGGALAGILLEKGRMEAEAGRCEEAARSLEELQRNHPGSEESGEAYFYLALCDLKRGGYQEASDKLSRFIQASPRSAILPEAYFKLAAAQYGAGNLNLAARNYALAAESSKDGELVYTARKNLGRVHQQLEQWSDAAATWQKLAEDYPERDGIVEVLFDLGFAYNQAGRNELAYDVYRRIPDVATDEEQQGRAHYWAGMSLKSLQRYDEAIREFLRVPYLRTGGMWGVTSKLEAASCYELAGDLAQAKVIYDGVLAAHGASSDWGRVASDALRRIGERQAGGGTQAPAPDKKE